MCSGVDDELAVLDSHICTAVGERGRNELVRVGGILRLNHDGVRTTRSSGMNLWGSSMTIAVDVAIELRGSSRDGHDIDSFVFLGGDDNRIVLKMRWKSWKVNRL